MLLGLERINAAFMVPNYNYKHEPTIDRDKITTYKSTLPPSRTMCVYHVKI